MSYLNFANTIDKGNHQLFIQLNAGQTPEIGMLLAAWTFAELAVYLVPFLLIFLWLRGSNTNRSGIILTVLVVMVSLTINQFIQSAWPHPRPFSIGLGLNFLEHVPNSSFPSDHATFLLSVALGLERFARLQIAGLALLALTIPVAYARIYLGVHYPFDMVGAVVVAILSMFMITPLRSWVEHTIMPDLIEPLHNRVFRSAILKGWVKS